MLISDISQAPGLNVNYQKASWLLKKFGFGYSVDMNKMTPQGVMELASLVKESRNQTFYIEDLANAAVFVIIQTIIRREKIDFVLQGLAREYGLGVPDTMIELGENNPYGERVLNLLSIGPSGKWDIRASTDEVRGLFADFPEGVLN